MKEQPPFDVAIIGAGPGGYVAAIRAAQLGLNAVVIERDGRFGGTCTLRGCIPTKALLRDARLYQEVKKAVQQGTLKAADLQFDFAKIQERKRDIINKSHKGVEFLFKKNKVSLLRGSAVLSSPGVIQVKTADGTSSEVKAKNIIVATGSEAKPLPGYTLDEKRIISNIGALDLTTVPGSLLVVGAGAVGVEFASLYNALGSKVTLIEALPALLPIEDADVSKELMRVFTKKGMTIHTGARLQSAVVTEAAVEAVFLDESGAEQKISADALLMATGRAPNTSAIGLDALGVVMERGFVQVNGFMQTSVPGVYAIGDIVPTPQLAHVAFQEGIVAVEHIAGKNPHAIDYRLVPNCTYCEPQVASVGLTEAKAIAAGYRVKTGKFPFTAVAKARIEDSTDGFVKIVADEQYGEILGMHMIGGAVTETIAEAVAAMNLEGTVADMVQAIHAHPTLAEGLHEALEGVFGAAIHI